MYQCPKDGKMIVCPHFDCMNCDKTTKIEVNEDLFILRPMECIKLDHETALKEDEGAGSEN